MNPPISMVTISREYGSGGGEIAAGLAAALGWRLVDRELVHQVAARLGVREEEVAERDGHVAGIVERVGAYLTDAFPEMLLPPPPHTLDHDTVRAMIESIVREAAEGPPAVIVGHGGQCIFAGRPGTLHVRVWAPFEIRARRTAARLGLDVEAARTRTGHEDAQRRDYLRRGYGIDIRDERHYDVIVNTHRVAIDAAVAALSQIVLLSQARPEP